jgi:hypothetical protein
MRAIAQYLWGPNSEQAENGTMHVAGAERTRSEPLRRTNSVVCICHRCRHSIEGAEKRHMLIYLPNPPLLASSRRLEQAKTRHRRTVLGAALPTWAGGDGFVKVAQKGRLLISVERLG